MRPDPHQLRNPLKSTGGLENNSSSIIIGQAFRQVIEEVCGTFYADEINDVKAAGHQFGTQLSRPVRVAAK
jgi:hypothetical protein